MAKSLGIFTFETQKQLVTKYEFDIVQKQVYKQVNFTLFVQFQNHQYFYQRPSGKIYRDKVDSKYFNNPIFPEKIPDFSHTNSSISEHFYDDNVPKINDDIVFICCGFIFYGIVKNIEGFKNRAIDMKDLSQYGFAEKLLSYVRTLEMDVISKEIKEINSQTEHIACNVSNTTQNTNPPKKELIQKFKITILKKTKKYGKDIIAYKIKNKSFGALIFKLHTDSIKVKVMIVDDNNQIRSNEYFVENKKIIFAESNSISFWILDEEKKMIEIEKVYLQD